MRWMARMFDEVRGGKYPRLIDLPTGAGKTELVLIWLLALAWHGRNRHATHPVPRRLVWVVNRRVLVQQVFTVAHQLREKLAAGGAVSDVQIGLADLCGGDGEVFRVVQLRGQIVADREWSVRPTAPQLIIGTVDQIGSRILFQGYGLGKWSRPQHAGLLGVDAWIAVDEAHLVPAFVLTMRQLADRCAASASRLPPPFDGIFTHLPFWITELSATPGLPSPSDDAPFSLTEQERTDPLIADRVLAASSRRVLVQSLQASRHGEKPHESVAQALIDAAVQCKAVRIAIFVREVRVADAVVKGLKKQGIEEDHICKITGRIRGYERDRLVEHAAFKAFLSPRQANSSGMNEERWFLVGTAAAEVGLDADADSILCDFAPLPTLLQRLGRLDRRGELSRRHAEGSGDAPMMRVVASRDETTDKIEKQLHALLKALKADIAPYSPRLMAGTHWHMSLSARESKGADAEAESEKAATKDDSAAKNEAAALISAATWDVLQPTAGGVCTTPNQWLAHDSARVAAGPVVVPPVTETVLDYWSATTEPRSPHLSPHPFLYGVMDDDEGMPLVGVAFRLEVEALLENGDDAENDTADAAAEVLDIFKRFPPLRTEFHQVTLSAAREWLRSPESEEYPLVYRHRDKWHAKLEGESTAAARAALNPNSTLVLPATVAMGPGCKKLLENTQSIGSQNRAYCDVLEGVSASALYRRTIEPALGRTGGQGAWIWDFDSENDVTRSVASAPDDFDLRLRKTFRINGREYVFRYYRPSGATATLQFLDDHGDAEGHLTRAQAFASHVAAAVAPDDKFLLSLLTTAARHHDEGKRFQKWQRAFGWRSGMPELAKLHPGLQRPAALHGFRHEWESLRRLVASGQEPSDDMPEAQRRLWRDLLLHLVGVHHGHLRPSISDHGLAPNAEAAKQNSLRIESAERFVRLQCQLGRWRLSYLEALLKTADAEGSRVLPEEDDDAT